MKYRKEEYMARARELFFQGYNCSQAVAGAFHEDLELPLKTVARTSYGLGGGVGRLREICGTVSGMAVVIGAFYGEGTPDMEIKKKVYKKIQQCADKFSEMNGSIVCKDLLGIGRTTYVPAERTEEYYKKRPCPDLIEAAAGILYDSLTEENG